MGFNFWPFEKKDSSWTLSDLRLFEIFGSTSTLSGVNVGPETALTVPAVNAAVRAISESVASLPLNVLTDNGTSKAVNKDHPVYRLLNSEPNPLTSSYDFRLQMTVDVLLHGNAYAFVNRVGGIPRELIRLLPTSVGVQIDQYSGEPHYEIRNASGGMKTCAFVDIVHIKALSTNGTTGIAPIVHARESIALALALEQHAAKLMGNAGRPSGILKVAGKLTKESLDRLKSSWQASYAGDNAGKTAIFDQDVNFSPLTFNSVDLQFTEMRKHQIEEISRAFRVPLHLLSELGRITYSNAEELGQAFIDNTLNPYLTQWQGSLTRALLTPEERSTTTIEFDTSALTKPSLQVRTESYSRACAGPWLTPNEARALEHRPPLPGGDELNEPQGSAPAKQPLAVNDNNNIKEPIAA